MNRRQAFIVGLCLVIIAAGVSAFFYDRVPPIMPSNWDAAGRVNGYMPRFWGLAMMPLIMAFTWSLLPILPRISPRQFSLGDSIGAFNLVVIGILAVFLALHIVIVQAATGAAIRIQTVVPALVGALLIFIGNYMSKLRKNFFIGVRTPWTLASDEVWSRTHRLAGWAFALGGIALIVESIVGVNPLVFTAIIALVVALPVVYSYVLYKKIEGFGPNDS